MAQNLAPIDENLDLVTKKYVDDSIVASGGLTQATADTLYVNIGGDTMTDHLLINNADRLKYGLTIDRTVDSTTTADNEIFRVLYKGSRATWTNEKGNLRTSNQNSKAEVAMKVIGASQAEGGTGNLFEVTDIAGNFFMRVGVLGRVNFNKGLRMVGDTIQVRDSTEVDESTISQALGGPLLIAPKTSLSINSKKITSLADGTVATDAATKGQMDTADALLLPKTGGTITGSLTVSGTVTADMVDVDSALTAYSGTFYGGLDVNNARIMGVGTPQGTNDAVPRNYVDARTPKITVGTVAPSTPAVGDVWVNTT